jgi:DNA-binding NarL/FixJ family response regulator
MAASASERDPPELLAGAGANPVLHRYSVLLALVGELCGLLEIDELRRALPAALRRALPCDYVSLEEAGSAGDGVVRVVEPAVPQLMGRWAALAHEDPMRRRDPQDGRARRLSEVITRADLRALALYREVYEPLGVEHQIAFTLAGYSGRAIAVALSRGARDYSEHECVLADEARPFLAQAYRNALAYSGLRACRPTGRGPVPPDALLLAGLTRREAEVVSLIAQGRSNQHVAAALGISDRTVGKHLEHSYRKLGVSDRSTAAARVWELTDGGRDDGAGDGQTGGPGR